MTVYHNKKFNNRLRFFLVALLLWSLSSLLSLSSAQTIYSRPAVIDIGQSTQPTQRWLSRGDDEQQAVMLLIRELAKSETGKSLMQKAEDLSKEDGQNLLDIIAPGEGSMLDTTLVRRFSRENPNEMSFQTRSKILINRHHNLRNAVLDLAHELTHFVFREPFNPYEKNFTIEEFVENTVEGRGGEAEAYLVECQVVKELYPRYFRETSNCNRIKGEDGKLSRQKSIEHFYRVGDYYREFHQRIRNMDVDEEKVPTVSDESSQFISSAWGVPYPVAAIKEYEIIMGRVCENDEKRLGLLRSRSERAPASADSSFEEDSVAYLMAAHRQRCRGFLTQ